MKYFQVLLAFLALAASPIEAKKASQAAAVAPPRELSGGEMALAGAAATAFGVTIMHPVDTIKTLQQSSGGAGLNMIGATIKIMKDGGFGAMYSGLGPYVVSDGFAGALKFAT